VLAALACVDSVIEFDDDTPLALITAVSPDVLVKGGDYRVEDIVGYEHVREYGGETVVLDFIEGESSSAIIKRIIETEQH
jgi:D-beta-D-heptose 7-phosphate kinase/D-beta-D-heptose 1-phosphate adenosyltransferase